MINQETPQKDKLGSVPDVSQLTGFLDGPFNIRSLTLTGLFLLACLFTLYWGQTIFLPITLAPLLSFLLAPIVRALKKISIPEPIGAAVLLSLLGLTVGYGAYRLSEPAAEWMAKAPQAFRQTEYKLRTLKKSVQEVSKATEVLGNMANLEESKNAKLLS